MAYQQLINSATPATTMAADCTSGATSISVNSVAYLSSTPNFTIGVRTSGVIEWMLVTGISGVGPYTLTVTRPTEGSTNVAHFNGDQIFCVLTAGALSQALIDTSGFGLTSAKPTATAGARLGMRYRASDAQYEYIYDGAAWQQLSVGAVVQLAKVVTSGSQTSVDFTSISGAYSSLTIAYVARTTAAVNTAGMRLKINNDGTSGNYNNCIYNLTTGGAPSGGTVAPSGIGTFINNVGGTSAPANYPSIGRIHIENYAGTVFYKKYHHVGNYPQTGSADVNIVTVGSWINTAAITRLTFSNDSSDAFVDGSTFILWGEV